MKYWVAVSSLSWCCFSRIWFLQILDLLKIPDPEQSSVPMMSVMISCDSGIDLNGDPEPVSLSHPAFMGIHSDRIPFHNA